MNKKHVVIGTAGHIDHGKSALIKSLTGTDPDRLKEEKERGMTTDLGFAFYGDDITIIDVPGHEKFVRHMVAGASTIDFVILVIAADDSVMPQTVEHLEILKLLGVQRGFIALTKTDLVEDDWMELVVSDIEALVKDTFLEGAPIVPVSNTTQAGINQLKTVLDEEIKHAEARADSGVFRMPIDRCFVIKGFGTVVAGTVLSGKVKVGDTVDLMPSGKSLKIRGIQVHNQKVEEIDTGYRVAINLIGVEKEEIERGDILAQPGFYRPSQLINGSLHLLGNIDRPLKNFTRIRFHLGTKELLGRVVLIDKKRIEPGDEGWVQFRLETPAVGSIGDRYVIRAYSPQHTIGGGIIFEPKATKAKRFDEALIQHLKNIQSSDSEGLVEEFLEISPFIPKKIEEMAFGLNLKVERVQEIVDQKIAENILVCIEEKRGLYYSNRSIAQMKTKILDILNTYHQEFPTKFGLSPLELSKKISMEMDKTLITYILSQMTEEKLIKSNGVVSAFKFNVVLDSELDTLIQKIEKICLDAGYSPPNCDEIAAQKPGPPDKTRKAYQYLLDSNTLIQIDKTLWLHKKLVEDAQKRLIEFLKHNHEIRVFQFRDMFKTSRKYVLPLMIYFDKLGVTVKEGDIRTLGEGFKKK